MHVYDKYVEAVYASTPGSSKDPRACGAGGFAALTGSECISTTRFIQGGDAARYRGPGRGRSCRENDTSYVGRLRRDESTGSEQRPRPVKAEDVASLDKIDLRVILAVYGDADVDLSDAALVECDAAATKVRAAAAKAGVPVLLRVDSEEALRAYEGSDGVAYEISRLFSVSFFCAFERPSRRPSTGARSASATAWWWPRDHARCRRRSRPPVRTRAPRRRRAPSRRGPPSPPVTPPQTRPPSSTSRRRRPSRTARSSSSTRPRPARDRRPVLHTKNGPKTIRCGFTDSTESAAQDRRFT